MPRMTLNEVRQAGFECWCKQREKQGDFDGTRFEDVKVYALDRWAVNWLRHEMTDYDQKLLDQRGKVGAPEAKVRVLEKVMGAIAEAYPSLANEALRQFAEKKEEGLGV
ncbi:MAG: hypothetical protein OXM87_10745 [Truepera sp.]|nr:hypothetical protein [Truepera sp.]